MQPRPSFALAVLVLSSTVVFAQNGPVISTVAGGGTPPDASSSIGSVDGIVRMPRGAGVESVFYISRQTNRLYEWRSDDGSLRAVAGTGFAGYLVQTFDGPSDMIAGAGPNLLIADTGNNQIVLVNADTGLWFQWFGTGTCAPGTLVFSDIWAGAANLCRPTAIANILGTTFYVIDSVNHALWRVAPFSDTARMAIVDPRLTAASRLAVAPPLTAGGEWRVYVTVPGAILEFDQAAGTIASLVSTSSQALPVLPISFEPATHSLLYTDLVGGSTVLKQFDLVTLTTTILAGGGADAPPYPGGDPLLYRFAGPITALSAGGRSTASNSLDIGQAGYLHALSPSGLYTYAGDGTVSFCGDGGPSRQACLNQPASIFVDAGGRLVIADAGNDRLRVSDAGIISSVLLDPFGVTQPTPAAIARDTLTGEWYVSSPATNTIYRLPLLGEPAEILVGADLNRPMGLAFASRYENGAWRRFLYFADAGNHRIARIDVATGDVSTVVGNGSPNSQPADGFPGIETSINEPVALSYVDGDGCLFFAERSGHRVRMICEPGNGMVDGHSPDQLVQTVAGTGVAGFNGDDIDPLTAQLSFPSGVAEAENGLLLIADAGNLRVRAVDPFRIYTVAGGGSNASDDIEATLAAFGTNVLSAFDPADSLGGVTVARDGNNEVLYIADKANHRVRVVCLVCEPVFDGPPDLVISKAIQVSGQRLDQLDVQNGETVQFVIRVENVGGGPTTLPVTVTDTLHSALEVTGAPSSCTWFGQVVSCDIGRVGVSSADRVVELVLTVRVSPRAAGPGETSEIQNVASVFTGDDDDPGNNTSNSVTLVVHGPRSPELQIFKSIAGEPDPRIVVGNGASITFLLSVSNSGGPTTGPVTVTDTLDPRLSFVSGTDCSAQNTPGGQVVSCEIASLDDSHSHTFEVVTQVSATAAAVGETVEFVNVASVATPDEGFPADNTSPPVTVVVRGAAPPSVAVVQSIAGQADPWITVNNGAVVTFELAAGNSGGATTGPVTVTDTLDPRLRFVSGADCSAQDTPSGQVVTCQIAGLASGEIHSTLHTFAIATQVSPTAARVGEIVDIVNVATISTPGDFEGDNTSNPVTVVVHGPAPTPPIVTPPPTTTVAATETGGARANVSMALHAFLHGATATDDSGVASLVRVVIDGTVVDDDDLVGVGTRVATFEFRDADGTIGSAVATVIVSAPVGASVSVAGVPTTATDSNNVPMPITASFAGVSQPGLLTATPVAGPPPLTGGFRFLGQVYDIRTTAIVTPPFEICFTGSGFVVATRLYHYDTALSAWVDVTTVSTPTRVCGLVDSLSPFGLVVPMPANQAPALALPPDSTHEATSATGTPVSYVVSANDPEDGSLTAICAPVSGSRFPLGSTIVQCSAIDSAGATATGSFTITVRDTTPPVVTPPPPITIPATEAGGARASASSPLAAYLAGGSATDLVDPAPSRLAPQVAGADAQTTLFPVGATTTVTFRFRDASGNVGSATSTVTVTSVTSGSPRIAIRVAANGVVSGNRKFADLVFSNPGGGTARLVTVPLVLLVPTKGLGIPRLVSPALPLNLGDIHAGGSRTVRVVFDAPSSVKELSIVEAGTFKNEAGAIDGFLQIQTIVP